MDCNFLSMTLTEAQQRDSLLWGKRLTEHCLHFSPPSHGGWGIVRVGMLVPQSVMLFIAPPACGRHGAIAGIQQGFKDRLFYLYTSEVDLVTGEHLELVSEAVAEILETATPRPEALILCVSCVDYLLGSDFESIAQELELSYGIPVRLSYMNPIAMDGAAPPPPNMQKTIYSFIHPATGKDRGINLIGNFVPLEQRSELGAVLTQAGYGPLRHIGACETLDDLQAMGRSGHNLLLRPEGRLAAVMLRDKLGIPFCTTPVAYSMEGIAKQYQSIGALLGVELDAERYRLEALQAVAAAQARLGRLKLAVSSTANALPFEISRALTEYGFEVSYIFTDEILPMDAAHLEWLIQNSPQTRVLTNTHPTMPIFAAAEHPVDIAIGFTAGYYCNCSRTVPLTLDVQPYGYRAVEHLLNAMIAAWENPQDLRQMILDATIVI